MLNSMLYNIFKLSTLALGVMTMSMTFTSCDDFLSDVPKGQKTPTSYADFEAFLRDEYSVHREDAGQASILLNDRYPTLNNLNYYEMWAANYYWDETADRIFLNKSDETTYYAGYGGISAFNLIIENAPSFTDCTDAQRKELVAQARVLRAMNYFTLVNYYSDTYVSSTAASKGGVPLITSASVGAPHTQPSVQGIYDFILTDLTESYNDLPAVAATELHPNRATADAFMARVYLQMGNYAEALSHAEKALSVNDNLYDWCAYYAQHEDAILNPTNTSTLPAPNEFGYCENYNYRHGSSSYSSRIQHLNNDRAAMFEEGDARFLAQWKSYNAGNEQYYRGITSGMINYAGMGTVEVYMIKAECLARTNNVPEAMNVLNKVRQSRILADVYKPLTATTEAEAMPLIIRTKRNEMILTIVPFCDARRLNAEGKYLIEPTKSEAGKPSKLSANSHLWTFPFPQGAVENPGNGSIQQNVAK